MKRPKNKLSDRKRFRVQITTIIFFSGGMVVGWKVKGVGFGQLMFRITEGKLEVDTECMPDNFVKAVLRATMNELMAAKRLD